jgi:hypothetical protein
MVFPTILLVLVAAAVVAALGVWTFTHISPPTIRPAMTNRISLRNVGLCASNCIYPSPELSAMIFVNASAPLSILHLYVSGTDEGISSQTTASTMTNYALVFKAQPNNPNMPIVAGKTYAIRLVATFQNNSTSTTSATVVAVER